jgi:rhodanese-related sulfurtransferase
MQQLSPQQLADWLAEPSRPRPVLLDVREAWEVEICSLPDSLHIPMDKIPERKDELDPQAYTVVVCHHGARSFQVGAYLEASGFRNVLNLSGGLDGWARQVGRGMPQY